MSASLDLSRDVGEITAQLVDIESVSGQEGELADGVQRALADLPHLTVERDGDAVVARTNLGRSERVLLAGHLDTVPINDNLPSHVSDGVLYGCGTSDMKSGVAVQLRLAATMVEPTRDVTYVFYDCEEVEAERNGLRRLARNRPGWLDADFAVLMEPSGATVEGGCQGTIRVEVRARGERAHSARAWMGSNAIHEAGRIFDLLRSYEPRTLVIDGLQYREGLNAVYASAGVAGNVIPDECTITVNHRFAPDRSEAEAERYLRELFGGFDVTVVDCSPGALPGLDQPAAAAFVDAIGREPRPKFGWTDVARFAGLGVPAVNYGPGEPNLAHTRDEHVELAAITDCEQRMRAWLAG